MFYSLASTFAFFTAQASGRMMQEAETKPCTDAYFSAGQESRVRDGDDRYFRVLRGEPRRRNSASREGVPATGAALGRY